MNSIVGKLNNIAVETLKSDPMKARRIAEQAYSLAEENNDSAGMAEALNTLGLISLGEEKAEEAYNCFFRASNYYKSVKNEKGIAETNTNIGLYFLQKNKLFKAREFFEKAQSGYDYIGNTEGQAAGFARIANCYRVAGNLKDAILNEKKSFMVQDDRKGNQRGFENGSSVTDEVIEKYKEKIAELEKEMQYRDRQFTSLSIVLKQKNETLSDVKGMLGSFMPKVSASISAEEVKSLNDMMFKIRGGISAYEDSDWKNFRLQFERVQPDFYTRLAKEYPVLSQNELRHCAFLKLNMNNKEVASLLGINPKSVEIARYRIKKKLNLPRKTRLFHFISQF